MVEFAARFLPLTSSIGGLFETFRQDDNHSGISFEALRSSVYASEYQKEISGVSHLGEESEIPE